jgi:glycosyltransferase involved in cell wall biosynthesis
MNEIRLSIICPAYNRANLLNDCVRSAMPLLRDGAEFILVDDASTDGTAELAAKFVKEFGSSFVYERLPEKSGAQLARNRGIELARGVKVLFLDSDDVLVSGGVFRLLQALDQNPEADFAYGKVLRVNERLRPEDPPREVGAPYSEAAFDIGGYHWHTMAAVYRMATLRRVGLWNPELTGSQDWEYQARVKLCGCRPVFVDTVVGFWRQHHGNRVGTERFRPDYVRSVMKACESIARHAQAAGRWEPALQNRLAKKLLIHALEWGANGFIGERRECLDLAISMAPGASPIHALCVFAGTLPQWASRILLGKIYSRL